MGRGEGCCSFGRAEVNQVEIVDLTLTQEEDMDAARTSNACVKTNCRIRLHRGLGEELLWKAAVFCGHM